jgi:diaminopimelate epimerase
MTSIPFCKFQGFGNDYIVIERDAIPASVAYPDLARAICDRHSGAGSDGIAILGKLDLDDPADYFCEIVNPDGSIAGFSGNGTRCAVSYLFYQQLWREPALRLMTRSGVKNYTLIERLEEGHYWFEAEIGKPKFAGTDVPVKDAGTEPVVDQPVEVDDKTLLFSGVNVGNPVACVFVESFDLDWRRYGRAMEKHDVFPERANIVFVKVLDRENIEIRIWERGAGETSASGTASSGAAVLSCFTGRADRAISVISPGGTTEVFWRDDDEILITGRADLVYCGEWTSE